MNPIFFIVTHFLIAFVFAENGLPPLPPADEFGNLPKLPQDFPWMNDGPDLLEISPPRPLPPVNGVLPEDENLPLPLPSKIEEIVGNAPLPPSYEDMIAMPLPDNLPPL
ncbi:unnamed protein product, partial [Mesorhabditis belari]|uniref:Uncharacterized protein n=1 Tax=Mesorhabditis belari TaxID=2138241 RepID=A0AAF3EIV8_9BILA